MYFWQRKNGIRDSDENSAGCGILVKKERECGIRTAPPPFQTLWSRSSETILTPRQLYMYRAFI